MKTVIVILAVFLIPAAAASADICFKQHTHTDEYYYGGRVTPAEDMDIEIWFSDKTMAYITEDQTIVIDLGNQKLTWVNRSDSTYAETSLPFEWANIATEEAVAWLGRYPRMGIVKETEETKEINGRKCKCYDLTTWIDAQGSRYNETDEKMWVTTDLPLDWKAFDEMNVIFMKIRNARAEWAEALGTIKGYPILSDGDRFIKGFSVKTTEEVVEVLEKDPDPGVYSVPDGFTKKEKLTIQDIRG